MSLHHCSSIKQLSTGPDHHRGPAAQPGILAATIRTRRPVPYCKMRGGGDLRQIRGNHIHRDGRDFFLILAGVILLSKRLDKAWLWRLTAILLTAGLKITYGRGLSPPSPGTSEFACSFPAGIAASTQQGAISKGCIGLQVVFSSD